MRKRQVDKTLPKPEKILKFGTKGNKKYKIKRMIDSVVYGQ